MISLGHKVKKVKMLKIYVKLCNCEELYNLNDIRQAPRRITSFGFFIRRPIKESQAPISEKG
jgi:hypothetical protein